MNISSFVKLIGLVLLMFNVACTNEKIKDDNNSVTLIHLEGDKKTYHIKDVSQVNQILNSCSQKTKILLKKKPHFNCKLILSENGKVSEWKYSTKGYMMSADSDDQTIYLVKAPYINDQHQ